MTELVTLEFHLPPDQVEVVKAAVDIISTTMKAGAISNGVGSWTNRDALGYHVRKAVLHITSLWHSQDLGAREHDEPKLMHLYNAVTRLCMAHANDRRAVVKVLYPVLEDAE